MTEDNRRKAIAQEIRQSELALRAAQLLGDAALFNDALSRLYYALYHAMVALLLVHGVEPRRHRALPSLLGTHVVPTGALTAADVALVSRAYGFRDLADYERTWEATAEILAEALAQIEPLLERARARLTQEGWLMESGKP